MEQCPPGDRGRSVPVGQRGRDLARARRIAQERLERAARDEHRRRVEDVLAGRAKVDVVGEIGADARPQRPNQRDDHARMLATVPGQHDEVKTARVAGCRDRGGGPRRDQPRVFTGHREGGFDLEHRGQPRLARNGRGRSTSSVGPGEQVRHEAGS